MSEPTTIWFHPRTFSLCTLEDFVAESRFEIRGEWYHYAIPRDANFLQWLGWVKVGEL